MNTKPTRYQVFWLGDWRLIGSMSKRSNPLSARKCANGVWRLRQQTCKTSRPEDVHDPIPPRINRCEGNFHNRWGGAPAPTRPRPPHFVSASGLHIFVFCCVRLDMQVHASLVPNACRLTDGEHQHVARSRQTWWVIPQGPPRLPHEFVI